MKKTIVNEIKLEFPSRSNNEGLARNIAACFTAQMDPTLNELEDIKTAVSEAVTNAVIYAYPDKIGTIYLKIRMYDDNTLELTVRDRGCGIADVEQALQPMFTTGGAERSGMGFTIMESFMDSLSVRSTEGKGTVIMMKKRLSSRLRERK